MICFPKQTGQNRKCGSARFVCCVRSTICRACDVALLGFLLRMDQQQPCLLIVAGVDVLHGVAQGVEENNFTTDSFNIMYTSIIV